MNEKVDILDVHIDIVNMQQACDKAVAMMETEKLDYIFTPNSEIIMVARRDEEFRNILNSASMLTADGIGVVYASKILKKPISQRVPGYELMVNLLFEIERLGKSLFLFGSAPNVGEMAAENIKKTHPNIKIAGIRNGYFKDNDNDNDKIIEQINNSCADILIVCLGAPKQEKWIYQHKDKLKVRLALGLGGTIDVLAGKVERAPKFYQKAGLEWFYRLIKEPKRFWRMMDLPRFGFTVLFCGKRQKNQ